MASITKDDLFRELRYYLDEEEIKFAEKAYDLAGASHGDARRDSGDLYISHPIAVAYKLSLLKADKATISAALLHDCVEDDPDMTLDIIRAAFND